MRFVFACLLLSLSTWAFAKPPVPLLWKVENGAGTVYLLGSFHVLKADDYPLAASLEAAYVDAERLVFEVPPAQMKSPEVAALAQRYARFEDGRTLRGVISADTAQRLQRFLGSEAALAAADSFEPWYMGMNLAVMSIVQAGFDPSKGLDQHLMQRAASDAKPSGGLESIEDQLRALDATPMDEQEQMLAEALESGGELRQRIEQLHRLWRAGDAEALVALINGDMRTKMPQAYQQLNVQRNQRWLPQIEALLKSEDDHMVVVGAMHLIGDDGLVAMLKRQGPKVEALGGPDS